MRAFHRAGLFAAGLLVLAGAAGMIGFGRAVAQSDLEMPADPPVLSKPYRSSVPLFRRRPPPAEAVPPEAGAPANGWREPPGRYGARDGAPEEGATVVRESPRDSGFGPVKPAPAHDLAPDEDPEELRPPAAPRAAAPRPKQDIRQETRAEPPRAAPEAPVRESRRPVEAADEEEVAPAYAGVWGPSVAACASRRSARRGFLPAVIRPGSARAGKTVCLFRDTRRDGRAWTMTASCRSAGRQWTSRVRLTVAGSRLTWSSERGAATYTRCSRG
ncbi:hypothetical protein [Methylobacterium nonmethylotrophicum]|uniref:Uncharacterized protein n=1 Tax=Methylobacterium nonmethylotrophicum TaxID=1141884 RepID=A0A4Z0NXP1_9HYPH|nr:hypothetical protein [Methylobacterium nonmethylotrophicum]TGE02447.1 hypothetical protein EU555_01380 [Methylobacterium nonmethylotrophicum]